jgi:hypothetical protein
MFVFTKVCNFVSAKVGAERLNGITHNASTLLGVISRFLLLNADGNLRLVGSQITSNILQNLQVGRHCELARSYIHTYVYYFLAAQ